MPRKAITMVEHKAVVARLTNFILGKIKHPLPFPTVAGGYECIGWVLRVIDGDTIKVRIKMPHNQTPAELDIRLRGLWIDELDADDAAARARAEKAKADLEALCPMMTPVRLWTFKRTYYRYEGDVQLVQGPHAGQHLSDLQLARGIVKRLPPTDP